MTVVSCTHLHFPHRWRKGFLHTGPSGQDSSQWTLSSGFRCSCPLLCCSGCPLWTSATFDLWGGWDGAHSITFTLDYTTCRLQLWWFFFGSYSLEVQGRLPVQILTVVRLWCVKEVVKFSAKRELRESTKLLNLVFVDTQHWSLN